MGGFQTVGEAFQARSMQSGQNSRPALCDPEKATAYLKILFGGFRFSDADDPEVFAQGALAIFTGYTEEIVREVVHPRYGLQVRLKRAPLLSELKEACDRVAGEIANRERRAMLNNHRVLLDTPYGPKPEAEGMVLLQSPDAQRRLTPEERAALADRVSREIRAAAAAQRAKDAPPREDVPPPELSDPDAQRLWYEARLEKLKAEPKREYKLSEAAKATNAGRDWGAPDITYGPARAPQEAAE